MVEQGFQDAPARSAREFKAVLFDFDGVIGKTMDDNYHAWSHAFSTHKIEFRKEDYLLKEGFTARRVAEHFTGLDPEDKLVEDLVRLKEEFYSENAMFSFYEGVELLVYNLKCNGFRLGLVSGANYRRLSRSVGPAFLDFFDCVITADSVRSGKPSPEPYLRAAGALGLRPEECLVVENAPMGISAAKNAGMYCIAVTSTLDNEHLGKADIIINDITELEGLISDGLQK
jgi:beta-phosphoglucomutase